MRVVVVEEPVFEGSTGGEMGGVRVVQQDKLTILTPVLPASDQPAWGFAPVNHAEMRALLAPHFAALGLLGAEAGAMAWYYTPMAVGSEPDGFAPDLVVFDVMDDLASFRGAPAALREKQVELLARADLVFTGGPSLYEAHKDRHPHVHCFPSGVEANHFARAMTLAPAADLVALPRPVLGFYGVLDERLDFDLVAAIADARPDWSLALIGPLAKIEEGDLPRRPNIHYFGQQAYADLPDFLAGFDVALLPFARNEATRSISPTKTLEYLAGGKPIVSTTIKDVIDLYGTVVAVANAPEEFIDEIAAALAEAPEDRNRRLASSEALLGQHSWDAIAAQMRDLMAEALARPKSIDRAASPMIPTSARRSSPAVVPR